MNKVIKFSAIVLIILVVSQLLFSFTIFYKDYRNLEQLEKFNKFSAVISDLLHRTQQERGAAAGYIGSNGKKFIKIYKTKVLATNDKIKKYIDFLKHFNNIPQGMFKDLITINNYIKELYDVRKKVVTLQMSLVDELDFYTNMNASLLSIMDKLIVLTNDEKLAKAFLAYDNFERAKENMGIERAVLSGTFSLNRWDKKLFIRFVTLLANQKTFLHSSMIMTTKEIKDLYNKLKEDKVFKEVAQMEKIALEKEKNFGVDSVVWYKTITHKLNILDKVDKRMNKYNNFIIKDIRKNLLISILSNLGISILILFFVIYTLRLLKKENEELFSKATYDQLTGLYNRIFFISEFEVLKELANRENNKLVIIFIDLDGFKDINDSLGHEMGDAVLKEVAKRIKNSVRKSDVVARFGGDEFLIMLNNIKKLEDIDIIVNKLLSEIKKPIVINNIENRVSASIGVSVYPDDGDDIQTLIKNADISMYKSKQTGKDRVTFYQQSMSEDSKKRQQIKTDLFHAIEKNQFKLYYQPQIDKNDKIVGIETLIRWEHPEYGYLSPSYFIPLAVEVGIIEDIDNWVIQTAIKQAKKWLNEGYEFGKIYTNLTIYHLEKLDLYELLNKWFKEFELDYKYFGFEIKEEYIMRNPHKNIETLKKLKNLGISISIDDFGTGYSSFEYLQKLPIDALKIDRAFIKDLEYNQDEKAIISIIIALAKQLKLQTIAEGVENEKQKDFVFSCGCDVIQGFYYTKPIPAKELEDKFLKE